MKKLQEAAQEYERVIKENTQKEKERLQNIQHRQTELAKHAATLQETVGNVSATCARVCGARARVSYSIAVDNVSVKMTRRVGRSVPVLSVVLLPGWSGIYFDSTEFPTVFLDTLLFAILCSSLRISGNQ